jgi:hypothetical protein
MVVALLAGVMIASGTAGVGLLLRADDASGAAAAPPPPSSAAATNTTTAPPTLPPAALPPFQGWVDPASVGQPYYQATVPGLLTFRGNPTRTYYGQGPVPVGPGVVWKYPGERMCALSEDRGETSEWCGVRA